MTTKNAIEAAKITKELKNFTLMWRISQYHRGLCDSLNRRKRSRKDNTFKYISRNQA